MIVEKLADELRTEFARCNGGWQRIETWLAVARRAVELLGDKPVATREAVSAFMTARGWSCKVTISDGLLDDVLAALAHFAPPRQRMMIEGMIQQEIEGEFLKDAFAPTDRITRQCMDHASHVAHRLANTPAPEVDADAGAKTAAWAWAKAVYAGNPPYQDENDYWNRMSNRKSKRNGWRAVAAMEKGNE